jgi:hypothetical protein
VREHVDPTSSVPDLATGLIGKKRERPKKSGWFIKIIGRKYLESKPPFNVFEHFRSEQAFPLTLHLLFP